MDKQMCYNVHWTLKGDIMHKRRMLMMVLALVMIFTACSSSKNGAVATVDGVDISQERYDAYYMIQRSQMVAQVGEEFLDSKIEGDNFNRTYGEALREDTLDMLINHQVILNAAEKDGIDVTEELEAQIAQDKEFSGEEYFQGLLDDLGITEEEYKMIVRDAMMIETYKENLANDIEIDDADISEYYEAHKEELSQVAASHILVETEEEARNILKRLEEGENFEDLAMELSQDPGSAANGGDLDFFAKEMMVEPFGDVAYDQEIGEISEPVETDFGFHIIKTTDKKESLDDVKDEIRQVLQAEAVEEEIQKMEKDAKIKKHLDPKKEPESIKERVGSEPVETTETPETTEEVETETTEDTTEEKN